MCGWWLILGSYQAAGCLLHSWYLRIPARNTILSEQTVNPSNGGMLQLLDSNFLSSVFAYTL